jgi:hypothetical protein
MARSEGYLGSKIDQKTHPRNQNQFHRAATSFLAGETVGFCADAHAGPYLLLLRACHQEIVPGKSWSIAQLQHTFRLRVITNQVEHNLKARLTKARKVA